MYRLLTIASLICIARAMFDGTKTSIARVPYQASIIKDTRGFVCGGSIISEELVLTAAHCVLSPRNYSIRVGSRFPNRGGTVHQVADIIVHGKFRPRENVTIDSYHNDVALLKVSPPIKFDGRTKSPIGIYGKSDSVKPRDVGLIAGWATGAVTKLGVEKSKGLSRVDFPVIDLSECLEDFEFYGTDDPPQNNFCAKDPMERRNVCEGDAGGAFVINGRQAGILSWGWESDICIASQMPSVYVDVGKYHDWIAEHAGLPSKSQDELV